MTSHTSTSVLISGASIGGPALAHWLIRYGFDVTVVERSPELRTGGQAVDFKGATHDTVLTRMGIRDDIYAAQTGGTDLPIVNARGRTLTTMGADFSGGDVEIRRGDLARLLYDRTVDHCDYRFGDSITSLTQTDHGVHVTFERGAPQTFDLVVGADGIHSNTRRLAFGPESDYVKHSGHYYALVDMAVDVGDPWMYNEPGRMVSQGGPKAPAFFVFASDEAELNRAPLAHQKAALTAAYAGAGFRVRQLIAALPHAENFYLDSISRVAIDRYSAGRVALLGDAGYGNTLGGFGTGLALVGAYVLAGELAVAGGDHTVAFARYQAAFAKYAKVARNGSAGRFLAPLTARGITMRNWMFKYGVLFRAMERMTDRFATDIDLVDYPTLLGR